MQHLKSLRAKNAHEANKEQLVQKMHKFVDSQVVAKNATTGIDTLLKRRQK